MKSRAYDTLVGGFQTTRWEMVVKAAEPQGLEQAEALEELCRIYWPAIYSYVRRKGFSPVDAQDITQDFLFHLVKGTMLREVQKEKGRFRSYLAACCNHFISNRRDAANTLKRGGGIQFLSLDFAGTELGYEAGLAHQITAETEYARGWVRALLGRVMTLLQKDYEEDGKGIVFSVLQPILTGEGQELSYRELAAQIDTTESNIQVMVHRLRRKFCDVLKEEIRSTLTNPSEIEDELRYLLAALA